MRIEELYRINPELDPNYFSSLLPGQEISECISAVVDYCIENKTSATLSFNGIINRVESWIDPKELANVWYSRPTEIWYQSQRSLMRNHKIKELGI